MNELEAKFRSEAENLELLGLKSRLVDGEVFVQPVTDTWDPSNDFISNSYAIYQDNFGVPYKR